MHCSKCSDPPLPRGWAILARTWKVAWTRQEAAVHGWKCVAGPVAAKIQYCLDLHINVQDPLRWVHSSGVLVLDVSNPGLFLSVMRFLTKVVALERAARFGAVTTAKGAQEGVDWSVHRETLEGFQASLPKMGFPFSLARTNSACGQWGVFALRVWCRELLNSSVL